MAKPSKASSGKTRSVDDVILVMPEDRAKPRTAFAAGKGGKQVTRSLGELKNEWSIINQQVLSLINSTEQTSAKSGFTLDEVTFALAINAKGQIGFIIGGEIGGEASISLSFKCNGKGNSA